MVAVSLYEKVDFACFLTKGSFTMPNVSSVLGSEKRLWQTVPTHIPSHYTCATSRRFLLTSSLNDDFYSARDKKT